MDVVFNVPGNAALPAGVTGFGAVFTDVDSAASTRLQFFAPDGALLFERAVPATAGNETQSFLGVFFDGGEIVGRVRIVSGNSALGPNETAASDLVAMDDFIYGEPVSTDGLLISPPSGNFFEGSSFDLVIGVDTAATPPVGARLTFDGLDATGALVACFVRARSGEAGRHSLARSRRIYSQRASTCCRSSSILPTRRHAGTPSVGR